MEDEQGSEVVEDVVNLPEVQTLVQTVAPWSETALSRSCSDSGSRPFCDVAVQVLNLNGPDHLLLHEVPTRGRSIDAVVASSVDGEAEYLHASSQILE